MFEGNLGDFSLADIFQLIGVTRKSGALRLSAGSTEGKVCFHGGEVAFALSDVRRAALGARLVAADLVPEEALRRAVDAKRSGRGSDVLRLLVDDGAIDEDRLHEFVREQVEDAVFELLRLPEATFSFHAAEDTDAPIDLAIPTERLIAEGNRRMEEWTGIAERIPSSDAVVSLRPDAAAGGSVTLDATCWAVVTLVDGRRSVRDIVDLCGRGEFATSRVLSRLVDDGVVEVVEPPSGRGALAGTEDRRDLLRRLEELELGGRPRDAAPAPEPVTAPRFRPGLPGAERNGDQLGGLRPGRGGHAGLGERLAGRPGGEAGGGERRAPRTAQPAGPRPADTPALAGRRLQDSSPADGADRPTAPGPQPVPAPPGRRPASAGDAGGDSAWPAEPAAKATAPATNAPGPSARTTDAARSATPAAPSAPSADTDDRQDGEAAEKATTSAAEERPAPAAPSGPQQVPSPPGWLDRAQVARELASLGLATPPAEETDAARPGTRPEGVEPRRLTRDDDVNRGLLLRLIDGVKGA